MLYFKHGGWEWGNKMKTLFACYSYRVAKLRQLSVILAQLEIPSNLDKINKATPIVMKNTTSHGRRPQQWKWGISQQPQVWSYPNLNLESGDQANCYGILKWRWPHMEQDLKNEKKEYHSNHSLVKFGKVRPTIPYWYGNLNRAYHSNANSNFLAMPNIKRIP